MDRATSKTLTQQEAIHYVKQFVNRARYHGLKVDHVYLFGSYAKNAQQKNSDVDICVVSTDFGRDYHLEEVELLKIVHEFSTPADVIPYHPKDLADKYDPLAKEVRTKGIQII